MKDTEIQDILSKNKLNIIKGTPFTKSTIHCERCDQTFYSRPCDLISRSKGTCTVCRGLTDTLLEDERVHLSFDKTSKKRKLTLLDYGITAYGGSKDLVRAYEKMYHPKDNEEFKFIKGTNQLYAVSNLGTVISLRAKFPKAILNSRKTYTTVSTGAEGNLKSEYVHRLVAETFLKKPITDEFLCVNHKDGNKHNNCVSNLAWVTYQENTEHAIATGLQTVTDFGLERIPVLLENEKIQLEFPSICDAGQYLLDNGYTRTKVKKTITSFLVGVLNPSRVEKTAYGFTITKI